MEKQYIYIVQALLEPSKCKIGRTDDLKRRLKEYNNMTGKSKENIYKYLFTCEVKDMKQVEKDITTEFKRLREAGKQEIYFYNPELFNDYVEYIKSHKLFVKEIFIKTDNKQEVIKIVKKTIPSLKERGLTFKGIMQKAQKIKNDEFYTRYEDVEKELSMYDNKVWKNKVVFCNCDRLIPLDKRTRLFGEIDRSPSGAVANDDDKDGGAYIKSGDTLYNEVSRTSAFALYFIRNFKKLELKKLICTHFSGPVDLFNQGPKGYIYTYIFTKRGYEGIKDYPENYNGSFDHPLSLKILNEEADIICTNPPFSKCIDYWDVTIKSGKKFLIISNSAILLTTAYIPYFKNNKVWSGYNEVYWFLTHKRELTRAAGYWFTNIPIKNRPKYKNLKIVPLKDIPEKYKKYDDSKILIVDHGFIPNDYKKPFGVSANPILNGLLEKGYKIIQDKEYYPYVNSKKCYSRLLVQSH